MAEVISGQSNNVSPINQMAFSNGDLLGPRRIQRLQSVLLEEVIPMTNTIESSAPIFVTSTTLGSDESRLRTCSADNHDSAFLSPSQRSRLIPLVREFTGEILSSYSNWQGILFAILTKPLFTLDPDPPPVPVSWKPQGSRNCPRWQKELEHPAEASQSVDPLNDSIPIKSGASRIRDMSRIRNRSETIVGGSQGSNSTATPNHLSLLEQSSFFKRLAQSQLARVQQRLLSDDVQPLLSILDALMREFFQIVHTTLYPPGQLSSPSQVDSPHKGQENNTPKHGRHAICTQEGSTSMVVAPEAELNALEPKQQLSLLELLYFPDDTLQSLDDKTAAWVGELLETDIAADNDLVGLLRDLSGTFLSHLEHSWAESARCINGQAYPSLGVNETVCLLRDHLCQYLSSLSRLRCVTLEPWLLPREEVISMTNTIESSAPISVTSTTLGNEEVRAPNSQAEQGSISKRQTEQAADRQTDDNQIKEQTNGNQIAMTRVQALSSQAEQVPIALEMVTKKEQTEQVDNRQGGNKQIGRQTNDKSISNQKSNQISQASTRTSNEIDRNKGGAKGKGKRKRKGKG